MKTSSAETPILNQNVSILIQGPPGGGKSTLMLQLPNLLVFDCDLNLKGPEDWLRKTQKIPLRYDYEQVTKMEDGSPRPVEECFDYLMSQIKPEKVAPYDWVGIDSLSMVNEFIIRKILYEQKKTEMEARHWQPFKTCAMNLLVGKLRHIGKNVIVTAHELAQTKPAGKDAIMQELVTGYIPFFQGKVGEILGAFFTDMWRCSVTPLSANRLEYKLETQRTALSDLKNSLGMPPSIINPTWNDLKKYFGTLVPNAGVVTAIK